MKTVGGSTNTYTLTRIEGRKRGGIDEAEIKSVKEFGVDGAGGK